MAVPRYIVGDVFDAMAAMPDGGFDLILTSPPFYRLRSYLPDDHPDKAVEIGSEATPAEFLDTMLGLTAEWRRLLAPHGSIAVELGDSYAGSSAIGTDDRTRSDRYPNGSAAGLTPDQIAAATAGTTRAGPGHPLDKSLIGIPTLYAWCLAYGRNLLTGEPSPAGQWRIRNVKPWIRTNPPVGALGDKERPATSYITVATVARDRYFDLDAVRTAMLPHSQRYWDAGSIPQKGWNGDRGDGGGRDGSNPPNPAGAPPLDWWHHVDAVLDAELAARAGKPNGTGGGGPNGKGGGAWTRAGKDGTRRFDRGTDNVSVGARGYHLRRALERAGILSTAEALDVSPKGYSGAHYAVWPPELCRPLMEEMCPRRVCTTCGQPSRRITESTGVSYRQQAAGVQHPERLGVAATGRGHAAATRSETVGWSDCGHDTWRPGIVLDPFAGSGTTLAVANMLGRDATGIDLDERNARLAFARCGTSIDVEGIDLDYLLPPLSDDEAATIA